MKIDTCVPVTIFFFFIINSKPYNQITRFTCVKESEIFFLSVQRIFPFREFHRFQYLAMEWENQFTFYNVKKIKLYEAVNNLVHSEIAILRL